MLHFIVFFFFNDPAATEISPLPLRAALPISPGLEGRRGRGRPPHRVEVPGGASHPLLGGAPAEAAPQSLVKPDRKSTRLNSSHANISYAVFCLKKKNISLPKIL